MEDSHIESSLTDMMTSLMVIFILLLVVFLNQEYLEKEDKKIETTSTLSSIKEALEKELIGSFDGITVAQDPNDPLTLVVIVPENLLKFGVDQYVLPPHSQNFLANFTPQFLNIVCGTKFSEKIDSIIVEGHTDSSSDDSHNLALSQKRSLEVMLKMVDYAETSEDCFLGITSASGRGEREVILVDGVENAPLSRRVQYKIRVKSLLNEEFKQAVGKEL